MTSFKSATEFNAESMRAPGRTPMPDLTLLLHETNALLEAHGLPTCHSLSPVPDVDTANPNVIASSTERKYVVKVVQRHPDTLDQQLAVANALRDVTDLPIPRHYCCAGTPDQLPLMIMEWLPGEQLRTVLAHADHVGLQTLCGSLAACIAVFHDPEHLRLVSESEGGFSKWLYTRALEVLQEIDDPRSNVEDPLDTNAVRRFLRSRFADTASPAIPALTKADLDLRDFLVDPHTFEITGMLDWERVTQGDGIFALTLIFLRLWLNGKLEGWGNLCDTYNRLAKVRAHQCPQAEFYLMGRAVLAFQFNSNVQELIELLLSGRRLPFESA